MTGIGLTYVAAIAGAVLGQTPRAATSPIVPKAGIQATASEPAYANTRRVPEELLDGTRRKVIILPREPGEVGETGVPTEDVGQRSGAVVAKITPEQHRLPEGYVIGSRRGGISREGDWFIARLAPREGMPDAPPLRILPSRELAMVEAILTEVPDSRDFLLTGRITEFQGVNYLLLEHVAQVAPQLAVNEPVKVEPATQSAAEKSKPPDPGREPTAEEILQHLMKEDPERALVLPTSKAASMPAAASPPAGAKSEGPAPEQSGWPEGTFLVDQLGRVVPGGGSWWSLAWEDRGELAGRKPVRLLPNRLLETAVALSGGGTRGVVFVVSGEITEYKGLNYLLLRKVLVRRDMGNLR